MRAMPAELRGLLPHDLHRSLGNLGLFAIFIASQTIVITITAATATTAMPIASPTCQSVTNHAQGPFAAGGRTRAHRSAWA